MAFVTRKQTAADAIRSAMSLATADEKIFLSRLWISQNERREDAVDVVAFALSEAVAASEVSLSATLLAQLAEPLRFAGAGDKVKDLLRQFDSLVATAAELGPSLETLRLKLTLTAVSARLGEGDVESRLVGAHGDIAALTDPSLKASGLSQLISRLSEIDAQEAADEANRGVLLEQVESAIEEVLIMSAEQADAVRHVLMVLGTQRYEWCCRLAARLNTIQRRDEAFETIVEALTSVPIEQWRLSDITEAIAMVSDLPRRDRCAAQTVSRLSELLERGRPEAGGAPRRAAVRMLEGVRAIRSAELRAGAIARLYAALRDPSDASSAALEEALSRDLQRAIGSIEVVPNQVEAKLDAAIVVAVCDPVLARTLLVSAMQERARYLTEGDVRALTGAAQLAIRASRGLLVRNNLSVAQQTTLVELCERVSSPVTKARLLSDLAVHLRMSGYQDRCSQLVTQVLRPLVVATGEHDEELRQRTICAAVPGLYLDHPGDGLRWLEEVDGNARQFAYADICKALLSRRPPKEPHDHSKKHGFKIKYQEAFDVVSVLRKMSHDGLIYDCLSMLCDSISDEQNKFSLTEEQKARILSEAADVVRDKFPAPDGISHEGYRIVGEAQVARLSKVTAVWSELLKRAEAIPNVADRALVLGMLAEIAPSRERAVRAQLVQAAEVATERITIPFERVYRYEHVASGLLEIDRVAAKRMVERGLNGVDGVEGRRAGQTQRRLIDLAHRIDPEFAKSLSGYADKDPVRKKARESIRERLKYLEAKDSIRAGNRQEASNHKARLECARAAGDLLGQLNSGASAPKKSEELTSYLEVASKLGLVAGFPLWAWIVENAVQKYADTDEARRLIGPFFDASVLTGDLIECVGDSVTRRAVAGLQTDDGGTTVGPGQRERGIKVIREWITALAPQEVVIYDQYFSPSELSFVQLIAVAVPGAKVVVITSRQGQSSVSTPWQDAYAKKWGTLSNEAPPEVDIVVMGLESTGLGPIHARYILAGNAGLLIDASLNGLGGNQESKIIELSEGEATRLRAQMAGFVLRSPRQVRGQKVVYEIFTL
jgi:hypothetical protein